MNAIAPRNRTLPVMQWIWMLLLAMLLSACGGGGGGGGTVVVPAGKALFTTAGSAVSLGMDAAGVYTIGGGGAGSTGTSFVSYSANSSNVAVVKASVNGSTLTLTAQGAGTATVTVTESAGTSLSIAVTVVANKLFISAPNPVTAPLGLVSQYTIGGGKAPYSVGSSNPSVAQASLNGNAIVVRGLSPGNATIAIYDATGASGQVAVVVPSSTNGIALFVTAPSTLALDIGAKPVYTVAGGTFPYSVSSSAPGVVAASLIGNQLNLSALASGTAEIAIVDAVGTRVQIGSTVSSSAASALTVRAASGLNLAPGETGDYAISGGTAPYAVSSSNASVVSAQLIGSGSTSSLRLKGLGRGAATVVVFDSSGASVSVPLTVGSSSAAVALYIAAPNPLSMTVANGPGDFDYGGGVGTMTAVSSNAAVASAGFLNGKLRITPIAAGTATIAVYDSVGSNTSIAVNVSGTSASDAFYTTAPAEISIGAGARASYFIGGGVGPYTAGTGNSAVATGTVGGSLLTIDGTGGGSTTISVFDANGASKSIKVTVLAGTTNVALHTTAPSSLSLAVGATTSFAARGGTGSYVASSSNPAVLGVSMSGSTLNLTGVAAGSARVVVFDGTGTNVAFDVAVGGSAATSRPLFMTTPTTLNLRTGDSPSYAVSGGSGAYQVSSSNPAVLSASLSGGNLQLSARAVGSAEVSVFDEFGSAVRATVTVSTSTSSTALYTTAPSTMTTSAGGSSQFDVRGGAGAYVASSSNTAVATVSLSGNTLTVRGVASGTAQIVVYDSAGTSVQFAVTVSSVSSVLSSTAPSSVTLAAGNSATYTVIGGSPGYTATSSNTSVVTASISGTSVTLSGQAAGTAQVAIVDAAGTAIQIGVTVGSGSALFTTAPATISMRTGASATYSIGGGVAPYTVSSSDVAVASVSRSGNSFTVNALSAGTASVAVVDAAGARVTLAHTVTASVATSALASTVPIPLSMVTCNTNSYTISGGTAPYTVSTTTPNLLTPSVSGSSLSLVALASGAANFTLSDSNSVTRQYNVTVTALGAFCTAAPTTLTLATRSTQAYATSGAVGSVTASSSNASVATVSMSGSYLVITAGTTTGTSTITVTDGTTPRTVALTVTGGSSLFTTAPSSINLAASNTASYQVGGGTGPYAVATSNAAVVTANLSGNTLTITTVAAGSATLSITDSVGTLISVSVTVP